MAASNNFQFIKGEDVEIDWTIRVDPSPSAAVEDISGWSFDLKLKLRERDADPSLVTPTIVVTDALRGAVQVLLAAAATAGLQGDYYYSFWRTNAGANACLSRGLMSFVDSTEN